MKNIYTYILVGSMAIFFYGGTYALDVPQRIKDLEQFAKKLHAELSGLKQCIAGGTCTKQQYEQIYALGKKIVIAAAALAGAALIGTFARSEYRKKMEPQEQQQYVVDIMKRWNISRDPLRDPLVQSAYEYLYAATTLPQEKWNEYKNRLSEEEKWPSEGVSNAAHAIRKERWSEKKPPSIWGREQIQKYNAPPLERKW
jgi:hypothetical protein